LQFLSRSAGRGDEIEGEGGEGGGGEGVGER